MLLSGPKFAAAGVAAGLILGLFLGYQYASGQEAKRENLALLEQMRLNDEALATVRVLGNKTAENQAKLTIRETEIRQVQDELQQAINREPVVVERRIEVPQNCPEVSCPVIDTRRHYRLWNDAIRNTPTAVPDAIVSVRRDGSLRNTHRFAFLDAGGRCFESGRADGMGTGEPHECGPEWGAARMLERTAPDAR